jgi:uncharacterized protein YebE (UPF0316 family)
MAFELIPAVFVPLFIFVARIIDVSIGTIRIMFVAKGFKGKATILGFFEVFLWIIIVAQIFQNLDNWMNYIAFAGGFAAGNYVGMLIEERMKMGTQIFRIITNKDSNTLFDKLKESNFRVTAIDGQGAYGPVKVIFTVAKRKRWQELAELISTYAPDSFYSVEDVRFTSLLDDNLVMKQDIYTRLLKLKKGI